MSTVYKIHPAIGIARVGNSPDAFFIGPERSGELPSPPGGFKDAQCRVKRQAARFRIFAHHDDGTVTEVTNADADITWTVHVANTKAAHPDRNNTESAADLTIDPGPRSLAGPSQRAQFDTGQIKFSGVPATTVPLGEMRTDPQAHLVVLGGFGKSASPQGTPLAGYFWSSEDWYDDVCDGPVTAVITLRSDGSTPPIVGAWVIVAPPKFAPHQQSVITLYDRILDLMVDAGLLPAPAASSYTQDVYPILQRARDTQSVATTLGAHTWSDPVITNRDTIFNRLKPPGDMPRINDSGTSDDRLTKVQYAHMQRWRDGNFLNDWTGVPAPEAAVTPSGLDRAALESCVGAAFFPGIEAGGLPSNRPIIDPGHYLEAFRLDHSAPGLAPGAITQAMALPWQNDFYQCGTNWWPVPRPNVVTRQGTAAQNWTSGVVGSAQEMVDYWHRLGFVVQQGPQRIEVGRCDSPSIQLLTPVLDFLHVPQGPMGMIRETALAITFQVISPGAAVTLQYAPGGAPSHPQLVAFNSSVTLGPTPPAVIETARLWVIYRTANAGDVLPPQTLTVQDSGGTQNWTVTVLGDTVGRKTGAAALVLDRSGSMSEDRGDGQTKHSSLQQAAGIFVDVMLEGDGAGVIRFNQDAQVLQPVLALGNASLSDVNRATIKDALLGNGLDPDGQTSIGDGIFEGRGVLNGAGSAFDMKSLVVLTDGIENQPRWISDVASQIDAFTYSVGLGQPQNISVPALQAISGNNGGYLLVTGAIGADNRFLLQKYFLQILAGISNAEIVLDPEGQVFPGRVERVPFQLTRSDAGVDVILLTPTTGIVDFRLETPSGQILEPWRATSEPGIRFVLSSGVSYYRLGLPFEYMPSRFDAEGTWYALLTVGRPRVERSNSPDGNDPSLRALLARPGRIAPSDLRGAPAQRAAILAAEQSSTAHAAGVGTSRQRSVPYSIVVHAYSNLALKASLEQSGFEPGATLTVHALLAESGIPLAGRVATWAEVRFPDGSSRSLAMPGAGDGQFTATMTAPSPGVYRFRVRAAGQTRAGEPFTREQTLTGAVWRGGDGPSDPGDSPQAIIDYLRDGDTRVCELIACLVRRGGLVTPELERRMHALGLDLEAALRCLGVACRCDGGHGGD